MPVITDLQVQKNNKTRVNVFTDGEFCCALQALTVMQMGLKVGLDVSPEELRLASQDSERSVAMEKAFAYLSRGSKTVHQMRAYLAQKGFSQDAVEQVIAKLKGYKYLDDDDFARRYVEQNSATKGSRRLRQELVGKGISITLAEQHSAEDPQQALENARLLAERYMRAKQPDVKTLQRLQRYLLSRGYDYDTVNTVLRLFAAD